MASINWQNVTHAHMRHSRCLFLWSIDVCKKQNKMTLNLLLEPPLIGCRQTQLTATTSTLGLWDVLTSTKVEGWGESVQLVSVALFSLSCPVWEQCSLCDSPACWHLTFTRQPWRVLMRQCGWRSVGPERGSWLHSSYQPLVQRDYRAHAVTWQWRFQWKGNHQIRRALPLRGSGRHLFKRWCHLCCEMPVLNDTLMQGLNK